jgi:hypothetical protein
MARRLAPAFLEDASSQWAGAHRGDRVDVVDGGKGGFKNDWSTMQVSKALSPRLTKSCRRWLERASVKLSGLP